jgi:hypothetical protein
MSPGGAPGQGCGSLRVSLIYRCSFTPMPRTYAALASPSPPRDQHCPHRVPISAPSRRDRISQPRVARNELPWVRVRAWLLNSARVASTAHGVGRCNAFSVEATYRPQPRVARSSQPWAGRCNTFGIEERQVGMRVMICPREEREPISGQGGAERPSFTPN